MPIAGVSHWRREPEFCAAQAAPGLDLIDDRLFWAPLPWIAPEMRSMLWRPAAAAWQPSPTPSAMPTGRTFWASGATKRSGAWSFPHEAADQLLGVYTAMNADWDALVRRGIFIFPAVWGEGPAGTSGGEDIFQIAEVINGSPHIYALWPHAASLFLRGPIELARAAAPRRPKRRESRPATGDAAIAAGWDPAHGRLLIDTPYHPGRRRLDRRRTGVVPTTRARDR